MKATNPMKRYIRESNLIEGIDDPAEDRRSYFAWNRFKKVSLVSQPELLSLHRRITHKQLPPHQSGHYRQIMVRVGDHIPPEPWLAMGQMYNLLAELMEHPETMDPIKTHVRFETIHPFVDGNGRTGRMLLWWHELHLGRTPTLFYNAEKWEVYYPLFRRK